MADLVLLRHAEAVDQEAGSTDFARALTPKGERQADRMGRLLARRTLLPDLVISSPAARAIQTARRAAEAAGVRPDLIVEDPAVYEANIAVLLEVLRRHGQTGKRLMLVGHNPSLRDMAALLGGLPRDFELGKGDAVALVDTAPWRAVGRQPMELAAHLRP